MSDKRAYTLAYLFSVYTRWWSVTDETGIFKKSIIQSDRAGKGNGKMITKHETVFDVDVKYFDGEVDFVQKVKMKGTAKTNITGSVTFMVCNDEQCLPPTTQKFSLALN